MFSVSLSARGYPGVLRGKQPIVTFDGKALVIAEDVKDPVSADDLEKAFKKA